MEENNTQVPETAPIAPQPSRWHGAWEFIKFVALVVVIVVGVRTFVAQPFVVSGASMVPTFQDKNYLIIDELSYHFKLPARGDVVVFHPPVEGQTSTYYIKRVIGIPGDTVTIKNGVITIKNLEYPDGLVLTEEYITKDSPDDNFTVEVTEKNYFVMGDNRPASYDSRRWGLLPRKNISGRVFLRLFPINEISVFPGEHSVY
jgi:signal peptidase I